MQEKTLPKDNNASSAKPSLNGKKDLVEKNNKEQQEWLDSKLREAAKEGKTEDVKELLREGANPFAQDHLGWDALTFAVWDGHTGICELLLKDRAENEELRDGMRAAMDWAASRSHRGTTAFLRVASLIGIGRTMWFMLDLKKCLNR
jgi:ankyrin repeat protein